MGVYASDVAEFARSTDEERAPLGERLRGMAGDLDIDSVDEVRDVRERI